MSFEPITYIGELAGTDPEAATKLLRKALFEENGQVTKTAKQLGISRAHINYLFRKLGMTKEPQRARDILRTFFRLPDAASVKEET